MFGLLDESQHAISSGLLKALVGAAISQSTQMGCESRSEESMVWMFGIPQGQRCRLDASKA